MYTQPDLHDPKLFISTLAQSLVSLSEDHGTPSLLACSQRGMGHDMVVKLWRQMRRGRRLAKDIEERTWDIICDAE